MIKLNRYALYAWGVLTFNIFVVVWGAFVRATGSGAGCGSHWPSCNGEVIPRAPELDTIIEYTHRITSGMAFLLVVGLIIWAFRAYPKGHAVRLGASWSMTFMVIETLVGAGLVIFHLVAYNLSIARAIVMAIHLINTFLLLGALTVTAWWASGGQPFRFRGQGRMGWLFVLSFAGMLFLGASGGVTALGDTLFPAESLIEGLMDDLSPTAHFLIRLRVYHPLIAIGIGAFIATVAYMFNSTPRATTVTKNVAKAFVGLYVFQLILGAFNVVLLAPVWIQLVHLFVSDILLILLVIFLTEAMAQNIAEPEAETKLPPLTGEKIVGHPGQ
jgi:heme A synthase